MMQVVNVAGEKMPAVGLGLWKLGHDETAESVYNAIKPVSYTHLTLPTILLV